MKPIIILPPGAMKPDDIKRLNDNDLCVVEADDPARVRFLDPIPAIASRTDIENAAIQLSRTVLRADFWTNSDTSKMLAKTYVDILVRGTPLDPHPSQEEREEDAYNEARVDEIRKLAREEARAARAALKKPDATTASAKVVAKT